MALYKVTFKGGGPTRLSNQKRVLALEASSPHVAVARAMRDIEAADGFKLPKGAWVHLTVSREG